MIGILTGMGPKSTGPFIDQVVSAFQSLTGAKNDIDFPPMMIYSLPTPFYVDRPNVLFDVTINSADYGFLKKDDNGKLFDIALASLDEKIENSLMIDDSDSTIKLYEQKGGQGFRYHGIAELKSFLQHQAL